MAPIEELQKFNIGELLADMARFVAAKCTIDAVKNCFAAIDESNSKFVDAEDFRWAMIDLGYNLSKNEAEEVVNYFDKNGSGKLNYEHLIAKLQVSLLPVN
jgi:Ca2+-binding EF-hand superfamily protein